MSRRNTRKSRKANTRNTRKSRSYRVRRGGVNDNSNTNTQPNLDAPLPFTEPLLQQIPNNIIGHLDVLNGINTGPVQATSMVTSPFPIPPVRPIKKAIKARSR
jgi:hypothetical protein